MCSRSKQRKRDQQFIRLSYGFMAGLTLVSTVCLHRQWSLVRVCSSCSQGSDSTLCETMQIMACSNICDFGWTMTA
ncbi:hypothetical protein V3C99_007219 [Haemonchus contortus]